MPTNIKEIIQTTIIDSVEIESISNGEVGDILNQIVDLTNVPNGTLVVIYKGKQNDIPNQGNAMQVNDQVRGQLAGGPYWDRATYNGGDPNVVGSYTAISIQGPPGPVSTVPGPPGPPGPAGPASSALTNVTTEGGLQSAPVPITVDILTSSNTGHKYYSVPNFTNDQSKIGTKIFVRNPTIWAAYIMGEPGVGTTFYTHTTALPNGTENFEGPLMVESMRSTELMYLGNIGGYERWTSHLLFAPLAQTAGNHSTKALGDINQSNLYNNINVVSVTSATDNYVKLNPVYVNVGEAVIIVNTSQTNSIRLLNLPLHHMYLAGIDYYTVPYVIPAGKSVRFTKGPSSFYWLAEIMHYE